jgi:hypothetical protein
MIGIDSNFTRSVPIALQDFRIVFEKKINFDVGKKVNEPQKSFFI